MNFVQVSEAWSAPVADCFPFISFLHFITPWVVLCAFWCLPIADILGVGFGPQCLPTKSVFPCKEPPSGPGAKKWGWCTMAPPPTPNPTPPHSKERALESSVCPDMLYVAAEIVDPRTGACGSLSLSAICESRYKLFLVRFFLEKQQLGLKCPPLPLAPTVEGPTLLSCHKSWEIVVKATFTWCVCRKSHCFS